MILLIDNYDSFAHNLGRYFRQLGQEVKVVRNDAIDVDQIETGRPAAIVMSPGPGTPRDAGICVDVARHFAGALPMLGVCLGHQAICEAFGGQVIRHVPIHGQSSQIVHSGDPLFRDIPSPLVVGRYHSLIASRETIPNEFEVIAETEDRVAMAIRHRTFPVFGVQFHPESILTEWGYRLLANFLNLVGVSVDGSLVDRLSAQLASQQRHDAIASTRNSPAVSLTPHAWSRSIGQ